MRRLNRFYSALKPKLKENYFKVNYPLNSQKLLDIPLDTRDTTNTENTRDSSTSPKKLLALPSPVDIKSLLSTYSQLSKSRLLSLVLLTTMTGYAMSPQTCLSSPLHLLSTSIGTALCISSANTFNQVIEVEHDAKMSRTKARPLVVGKISKLNASLFGLSSGILGSGILYVCNDSIIPFLLGFFNILLYTLVYTPLKRKSVYNTQLGSIVGAIPPLIGYTSLSPIDSTAILLSLLLYSWQFPHFNALSYKLRNEYKQAGYVMLSHINENKNAEIALRHSILSGIWCLGLVYNGSCNEMFLLSLLPSIWMGVWSWRFFRGRGKEREKSGRQLFYVSLFHLPVVVLMMLFSKKKWVDDKEKEGKDKEGILGVKKEGKFIGDDDREGL